MRLQGKTVLVTGASRNIGKATALACAREGAALVLNTRSNQEELQAVATACQELGAAVLSVVGDVSDAAQVMRMVEQGLARFNKIDVVVSNAAIRPHRPITEVTVEEWHQVLAVNLHASFYLCKAVVPAMIQQGAGSIIVLGGLSSLGGRPNTVAVTVAKTGLLGLVRALAAELGPHGIRVNMVVPGAMDTERRYPGWYPEYNEAPIGAPERLKDIPLRRLGKAEEVAAACVFLASDESSYITGDRLLCIGGRFLG
jgi:NAD(P)-dependent dehydrogenase (short-subunit alcohol dehydrogenase family)